MEEIELKGYYNEQVLHGLLDEGKIGNLEYVTHLDEETKTRFYDYCARKALSIDEETAESFMKILLEEEKENHKTA